MNNIKKILTAAGSDSCGGAGIQADIKTISACGHYAMTVITAVTAQNSRGVQNVQAVSPEMVASQLDSIFTDLRPDAVKTGMLLNEENVKIIADRLKLYRAKNIVCDTVIMSTSGRQLLDNNGIYSFLTCLAPISDIITPNIPEAERLTGKKINDIPDMKTAAARLYKLTGAAVLIKGGHLDGNVTDILCFNNEIYTYEAPRIKNPNTHGTGCTLSSAIACGLAEGMDIPSAVDKAKKYINAVISAGLSFNRESGPMWHFVQDLEL